MPEKRVKLAENNTDMSVCPYSGRYFYGKDGKSKQ